MSALNRRSILAGAAAAPIAAFAAAATPSTADATISDDTIERIAEHRRLGPPLNDLVRRMWKLEEELPDERRKAFRVDDRGTDVGKNDDPRWTMIQAEYWAIVDRRDEVAWLFVDKPPTTVAGLAAILSYAEEHEEAGNEWPDARIRYTEAGRYIRHDAEDWRRSLDSAIAVQLSGQASKIGNSAVTPPLAPSTESRLLELERQAATAEAAAIEAGHPHTKAEEAMIEWKRRNPKPVIHRPNEDSLTYESDWNRATAEYVQALERWNKREKIARANCRYDERETFYQSLLDRADAIRDEAARIPAITIDGLRCKARMMSYYDLTNIGGSLAGSIIDELRGELAVG